MKTTPPSGGLYGGLLVSVFNQNVFDATKQPMFFGEEVNVARYDKQKYPIYEKLIEKQLSFFWRPEEIDVSADRKDFQDLAEHEKHIFLSNLKYQTLLDSVQGRSPNLAFLPIVSIPELETWLETWAFSETIHSRSYTHIVRGVIPNPSEVFDSITVTPEIIERASSVSKYYDDLIHVCFQHKIGAASLYECKESLYKCMMAVNILEGVRFYVSFACSWAFAERAKMEGNGKIIKLIARDEALHLTGTQFILNQMANSEDEEFAQITKDNKKYCEDMFKDAVDQEEAWARYLFKDGSMIGLNLEIITKFIRYITDIRMKAVNLEPAYGETQNPIPWINAWLSSESVQVAPQETEISSYLVGQLNTEVAEDDFEDIEL